MLVDLYGGKRLDDVGHVERTLKRCVEAAGATLLHLHLQPLEPTGGITGVAVLAESHISIHSWPAEGYAALDVFMSGSADPQRTVSVLKEAFEAGEVVVRTHRRGKASKSRSNAPARKVRAA
ncbi:adenosylmethionine decarboxylase [Hyphomicrobium nitrativorans]|uniref:adenosylmethionine decarboxylase n=1 Tax=Hyphomicrobium nitrativorans TaxID=1427356 RepID=UPI003137AAEB